MAGPSGLMSRGLKAAAECKRPKYLNVTADSGANQQLQPRNLDALAAALEPLIGPWPANALELGRALYRAGVSKQLVEEGIDACEPGKQRRVHPLVRKGFVQVLDAPSYIDSTLVHALPAPELSRHLGSVTQVRRVSPEDAPRPGHAWYVVVKVPRLGRRLRAWQQTFWPDEEDELDGDAYVAWWDEGIRAGWDTYSKLQDMDLSFVPDAVFSRLTPNRHHPAWSNDNGQDDAPSTSIAPDAGIGQ